MSIVAMVGVLRHVPPGVIERNLAVAATGWWEGRPELQQLDASINIHQ